MLVADLPYRPRPYQVEAAMKFAALAARKRREGGRASAIIVFPTGCGKTREAYLLALSMGLRCLFVTITDALCAQVEREVRALFPAIRFGVVKAERDEYRNDFVLASVQTLGKDERLARCVAGWETAGLLPELVICDEGHTATKDGGYDRIIKALPGAHVVCLTATPERTDGKPLGDVFSDGVVHRLEVQAAVDDEYLVAVSDGAGNRGKSRRVVVPGLDEALVRMADAGKDPLADEDGESRPRTSIADKKRALTPEEREKLRKAVVSATAASVHEACGTFKRKVIAFTLNVQCAKDVAAEATRRGTRCAYVHGQMVREEYRQLGEDWKDEQGLLGALRAGKIQALANCQVLIFGYDDPSIDGIVWGRPTMSRLLWCQGVGRGMRLDPARPMRLGPLHPEKGVPTGELNPAGKRDVIVWDLVGAYEIHGLQTAENIFRDAPEASAPGADDAEAEIAAAGEGGGGGAVDRERDLLLNFVRALSGRSRPSATRGSRVAWLPVEEGNCYAIPREDPDGPTFTIERAGGGWVAFAEAPGWDASPSVRLTGVVDERDAKAACELAADAGSSFGARDAGWRFGKPSARMLAAAKRLRVSVPAGATAGAVGDAISAAAARLRRRSRPERGIVSAGAALLD